MRIYVASSWKNTLQPSVVAALREAGHDVYDFRNPVPGDHGFSWKQCLHADTEYVPILDPRLFRDEVLTHPVAQASFAKDMGALKNANVTVLVLPCGRSAHLELGWAAGAGQRTVVLLDDPLSEPELMYLACTKLCVSVEEVLETLAAWVVQRPRWVKDHLHTGHCPKCGEYAQTGDVNHHADIMHCLSCGDAMAITCPPGCVEKRGA